MIAMNIDPISGEKYFEPNYNNFTRPQYIEVKNIKKLITQIHKNIYEIQNFLKNKSKDLKNTQKYRLSPEYPPTNPQFRPNEHSEKLFETRKLTKMREIFNLLDSDCDGLISENQLEIDNLPEIAFEIIKPILIKLQESQEIWDFERFV